MDLDPHASHPTGAFSLQKFVRLTPQASLRCGFLPLAPTPTRQVGIAATAARPVPALHRPEGQKPRHWRQVRERRVATKVNLTGGNRSGLTGYRSNRSGPVPVSVGTRPAKIQILNLNSKNEKFPKILQGVMNLMVSNFLKNSFI